MNRFRFVSEGIKGVVRNGFRSVASIFILVSSLLLVGIFATIISVINLSVQNIDDFNEIVVYMDTEADAETVENAGNIIKGLNNIKENGVTFVSKEQALELEKGKFDEKYAYIFESYDSTTNPLPDVFRIEYESVEEIDALVYNLGKIQGVSEVKNRYEIAKNIQNFKNAISLGGVWLMVLLVLVSVFVISNTIRLTYHSREMEITVMRYIGATKRYITMPFVVEGAIIGLISGAVGYVIQYYLYKIPFMGLANKFEGFVKIPSFVYMNNFYVPIFFAAGLLLGVIGSALAIRKYMKV